MIAFSDWRISVILALYDCAAERSAVASLALRPKILSNIDSYSKCVNGNYLDTEAIGYQQLCLRFGRLHNTGVQVALEPKVTPKMMARLRNSQLLAPISG